MTEPAFTRRVIKTHYPHKLTDETDFTGISIQSFRTYEQGRLVFMLDIPALDGGATVNLTLTSGPARDKLFETRFTQTYSAVGTNRFSLTDNHPFWVATITVSGGDASFSLHVTPQDSSSSEESEALLESIDNKLDGPIPVVIGPSATRVPESTYAEVTAVASSSLTTITTYTVPVAKTGALEKVSVSGTNIATYTVEVNGSVVDKKYTWFNGPMSELFDFRTSAGGSIILATGDVVRVRVEHSRPMTGDFNARIEVIEIG